MSLLYPLPAPESFQYFLQSLITAATVPLRDKLFSQHQRSVPLRRAATSDHPPFDPRR